MKHWKTWQICLFTIFCVLLNVVGRLIAVHYSFPVWLDSFGTVLCAYLMGPVCGSMVGVTGNILYSLSEPVFWTYGLASVALALIVGVGIQRKAMESLLGAMNIAMLAAIASTVISTVLDLWAAHGLTGNRFGDAVISFLGERNVPRVLCTLVGQFYVDFLDKLVTILSLHVVIRVLMARGRHPKLHWHRGGRGALGLLLVLGLLGGYGGQEASAAQDGYDSYVQTVYNSSRGLPCGEANDIAQTTDGILWIGTYAGLYRYNGSEFRWMDGLESVRNANCLFVDEEGRLWIGTNDNGLAIVINEKIVNLIDEDSGLPSNSVRAIVRGADGYYYIGTTGALQILTLNDGLRNIGALSEMNYTHCLAADDRGNVAAVTQDGRLFLLRRGEILSSLRLTADGGDIFKCCGFDRLGRLVVGSRTNRLRYYDISGGDFEFLREIRCEGLTGINDLYFPGNGEMFITADNGVALLDSRRSYRLLNTNDFNNSIDNMLMDYQGNLWFTSSRLGLLRLAPSSFRNIYSILSMKTEVVNAVAEWREKLYFGTDKGLDACNLSCSLNLTDELTERLEGVRIRCLLTDSKGTLWICTYGKGVIAVDGYGEGDYRVYDSADGVGNRSRVVTELRDGRIAVGTDTGVSFIRDGVVERSIGHSEGLINSMVLTITELEDGSLLVGTDGDGIALLRDGEIERMLTRDDGLSSEVILRSVADPKGEGVFLVTSNGLCFMNTDGSIRQLNRFPYFNNYNIWARDEDTLFVMSSAGLYVTRRDELLASGDSVGELRCELLDSNRGLSTSLTANSWSYCDGEGNLYLPCDTGVFSINVWDYDSKLRTYRLSVPTVQLDGKAYHRTPGEAILVGEGVSRVELVPEVVNFSVQVPPVGYFLEGFDTDWTITSQKNLNSIMYTNLPAGEYTLRLAVFNNDRSSILAERKFALTKTQNFYETVGFRLYFFGVILLAAVFLSSLVGYHSYASMRRKAEMANQTIIAIAKAVDAKDLRTSQHSERVSQYAVMIARELGWSEKECEDLRKAAKMHDIGKIGIPDNILNKPARLTDEEYAVMKSHTNKGGEMLRDVTLIPHVSEGALFHHERYDGRGYPHGLKGNDIPQIARIIGVADAFDAMTANRIYRKQMDFGYVLEEMKKGRGSQFDPDADDALLRLIEEGKIDLYNIYGVTPEDAVKLEKAAERKNLSPEEAAKMEAMSRAVAEQEAADSAAQKAAVSAPAKKDAAAGQKTEPGAPGKEAQA